MVQISDELMAAFGRFIIAWSDFEFELGVLFSRLIDCDTQTGLVIFYASSGYASQRDLIKAVTANTGFKTPPPEIMDIFSEAQILATNRNDLVHGRWLGERNGKMVISVYKPRHKMKSYSFDVTLDDLLAWTSKVNELADRLIEIEPALVASLGHSKKNTAD